MDGASFNVDQHDRNPLIRRQQRQGIAHHGTRLKCSQPRILLTTLALGEDVRIPRLDAMGALPSQFIQAQIHGDARQPGSHGGITAELWCRTQSPQHRVLHDILSSLRVTEQVHGNRPESVLVATHDVAERIAIPRQIRHE